MRPSFKLSKLGTYPREVIGKMKENNPKPKYVRRPRVVKNKNLKKKTRTPSYLKKLVKKRKSKKKQSRK